MKVNTLRFGELDVDESQLFTFPMGILGFSSMKSFMIIELENQHPFKWMQSVEDPSTAFVLSDPLLFYPTYCAEIRRAELKSLEPIEEKQLILSVIMTITNNGQDLSANLCAPLIFNLANRRGMQYVMNDPRYPVKHFIYAGDTVEPQSTLSHPRGEARSLSLR
jgi:flagellar assembly factor FliW